MKQKLGLAIGLGARPAVFLGLLVLALLSATGWPGTAQAQVYGNLTYVTTGNAPRSPSLGDLDGDGKLDLVVANDTDNNVSVFLGNGDWTFTPATPATLATGTGPRAIALGDLDGDGKLDLVVANNGSNNISIFLGNGNGTFTPATPATLATGTGPRILVLSDANGDGKLDLLVTNCGSNNVSVFLGNGNGTFSPASAPTIPTGTGTCPHGLRLGDLDGDGKLDLVVTNNNAGKVSVFLGNGNGTFIAASPATISTGTNPTGLRLADLNGDGKLDLVVTNTGADNFSVLFGNGNGTFQPKTDYATGAVTGPTSPQLADMNADGNLDLIVVNSTASAFAGASIFFGNGDGTFSLKWDYGTATGPTGVAVGDLNGDGMLDFVVAGTGGSSVSIASNLTTVLTVFPNGSGKGTVTSNTGGINCPTSCRAYFSSNSNPTVTLTATPNPDATFIGWSGAVGQTDSCAGTGTCTVTMNHSRTISAMFEQTGTIGFAQADLGGTWDLFYYADSVTGNDPGWTSLTFQLDTNGVLTGGIYLDGNGNTGTFPFGSGAFLMDKAGLISGWIKGGGGGGGGGGVAFPYGKLSPSKTILAALTMEGPNGRGMIVGTKQGGAFSPSDLAGTWYSSYYLDYTSGNDPGWSSAVFSIDASGTVTGGNYTLSTGSVGTINGGTFPSDSNGVITSASITSTEGGGPTFPHGKMDSSKTLLAAVANEAPNGRALLVGLKGGRNFTTADLAGTWYFVNYLDQSPTNNPQWAVSTLTLNASGGLDHGSFVSSFGNFGNHDSGSFTIDMAGTISGSVVVGAGGKSFPHAKMDPSKTVMVSVIREGQNAFGVSIGIKGGSTFSPTLSVTKAGTGTGTVTSSSSLPGIDCGTTCLAAFTAGDDVILTQTPAPGSTFAGWSGDTFCTGLAPCILPMTEARGVTATFNLIAKNTLTVSVAGSSPGSVSSAPSGINGCTGLACAASFDSGTKVTLTASVDPTIGVFREWRSTSPGVLCNLSTSTTCQVTMDGAKLVTAVFSKKYTEAVTVGTGVKAAHFTELRSAIDQLRNRNGLNPFTWNDVTLTAGSVVVKRQHLLDLRLALIQAYQAAPASTPPTYMETISANATPIKASHVVELRTYVRGLE